MTCGVTGVYLYLMPLGTGNAKSDSMHGWGFRWSSLWCCYGTAVESFAKLADSIFFRQPRSDVAATFVGRTSSSADEVCSLQLIPKLKATDVC